MDTGQTNVHLPPPVLLRRDVRRRLQKNWVAALLCDGLGMCGTHGSSLDLLLRGASTRTEDSMGQAAPGVPHRRGHHDVGLHRSCAASRPFSFQRRRDWVSCGCRFFRVVPSCLEPGRSASRRHLPVRYHRRFLLPAYPGTHLSSPQNTQRPLRR